jgi:signal transduction histidine kinase
MTEPFSSFDDITAAEATRLDQIVDRPALGEMVGSFFELFRVSVRVFGEGVGLLVSGGAEPELYTYLRKFSGAKSSVDRTIAEVAGSIPEVGEAKTVECFTGAQYRISAIEFEGRRIGRIVFGPYLPPTVKTLNPDLLELDRGLDPSELKRLLASLPRAKEETVSQIALHLHKTLDLILWSGHKALLTSNMHLLSVRESFRELQDKNQSLEDALDRLKELDRLKSNFLATVSHELRTPLTSIIGYSEMLKEGLAGPLLPEQIEYVGTIFEKGNQLLELITGLLDLSKLESGTLRMQTSTIAVPRLIEDVIATLRPAALKSDVSLDRHIGVGAETLEGDLTRLRQILLNLVDNALKWSPPGSTVTISADRGVMRIDPEDDDGVVLMAARQPAVVLSVRDTGIGIPDEEKTRVFDAFYQVDSGTTRQAGGTGLGLSIVRRLVEAHRGRVVVEDNTPRGAAFVVTIPLRHVTLS